MSQQDMMEAVQASLEQIVAKPLFRVDSAVLELEVAKARKQGQEGGEQKKPILGSSALASRRDAR
jgi:hypothetical protein